MIKIAKEILEMAMEPEHPAISTSDIIGLPQDWQSEDPDEQNNLYQDNVFSICLYSADVRITETRRKGRWVYFA